MYYFKFCYNFIYFIILFTSIKLNKNKNTIFLDSYINFDKVYLDNNIDDDYNNIVSYKEFLDMIFYFKID